MIELFHHPRCPYVQRTVICLLEKGVEFQITPVDFDAKPARLLELNPYGKVPLLVDHQRKSVVYESNVINEYLEEVFPSPPLLPNDPSQRAQARIWMQFADSHLAEGVLRIYFAENASSAESGHALLQEACGLLDAHLRENRYLAGSFSLAEVACMPFIARFRWLEAKYGFRFDPQWTHLMGWIHRLTLRPSYQRTDPHELLMNS